jgi:hypothetical protein
MMHEVKYGHSASHSINARIFSTQKEAVEFAESIEKQYRYIWLSEWGEYKTPGGRRFQAWIDYWWSPAVTKTDWGECPDAGWGRPVRRKRLVQYRRILYRGKRAHLNERASASAEMVESNPARSGS